ncbi:MAG: hypothetical protein GF350_09205 [Chitinivibrionales bacterium]|nr:hypothetical protein [Chitinivibrionales bacterium]
MSCEAAYFVSDAHLGICIPKHEQREKHLLAFLNEISSSASHLFILGDLFDFWIEYKFAIRPDYFPVLNVLKNLADRGIEIHYIAGNHDFALGSFLETKIGVHIHTDTFETRIQDRKIYLFHGDGLLRDDSAYRFLRKILRNKTNQRLYKLLHPNLGIPFAAFFSGNSRKLLSLRINRDKLQEYHDHAKHILDKGNDIVFFGHTHCPELVRWGNKYYCNTGEWIRKYTYAKLENGALSSWQYLPGKPPARLNETANPG